MNRPVEARVENTSSDVGGKRRGQREEFTSVMLRHKWLLSVPIVAGLILGLGYWALSGTEFSSESEIRVELGTQKNESITDTNMRDEYVARSMARYVAFAGTEQMFSNTLSKLPESICGPGSEGITEISASATQGSRDILLKITAKCSRAAEAGAIAASEVLVASIERGALSDVTASGPMAKGEVLTRHVKAERGTPTLMSALVTFGVFGFLISGCMAALLWNRRRDAASGKSRRAESETRSL